MRIYRLSENAPYRMEGKVAGQRFNRSTGLRDPEEAEAYMLRHAEKLRLESLGIVTEEPKKPVAPTLRQILLKWIAAHTNASSAGHIRNVSDHVTGNLAMLADTPIDEITELDLENALNGLLKGHTKSTVNGYVRTWKLLTNWALTNKLLTGPAAMVKKYKVKKKPRKIVHIEDFDKLVAILDRHSNPAVGGLVRFLLGTGVRLREALGARWEYFDEVARTYVPQGLDPDEGTKGGEAEHMAMPDWLFDYLMSLDRTSPLIFPSHDGNPYSMSLLKKPLKAAATELGLPRLYAHLLRISYASNLNAKGIDIRTIQESLRHANVSTTQGYIETTTAGRRAASDVMNTAAVPLPPARPTKKPKP